MNSSSTEIQNLRFVWYFWFEIYLPARPNV